MLIIGEKINSTVKEVHAAMQARDEAFIRTLAEGQAQAGADYIDINAGMFLGEEAEMLIWLAGVVEDAAQLPLCIDSPDPKALSAALGAAKIAKPILNSITGEKTRYNAVLPLVQEYNTSVIALLMDDTGMPENAEDRLKIADHLITSLMAAGVQLDDILIDPLVRPVSTGPHYGQLCLDTIRLVRQEFPHVRFACGLSNISFGLPARRNINQAFLAAAMLYGLDGAILDPLDKKLMSLVYAARAISGADEYCIDYLSKFRQGAIAD